MCIYNNGTDPEVASEFLSEFYCARLHMKRAAAAMLLAAGSVKNAEQRQAYKRAHKRMVKISRMWNQVEHEREVAHKEPA